ncbi:hypothetical protein BST61_g656 [Cercospora zeina]
MHFIYPLAALAASALAIPSQLIEKNNVEAVTGDPLLITSGQQEQHEKRQSGKSLQERVLIHHNIHRENHSAPGLTWDLDMYRYAKDLAQRCNFQHNTSIGGGGYGQNLAAGVKEDNITASITDLWYGSEFNAYDPKWYGTSEPDMSNFAAFGHFTQVVWKGTTAVGCYVADCSKTGLVGVGRNVPPYLTVCNYKAPGNYVGRFKDNVGKPLGRPVAKWNTGL